MTNEEKEELRKKRCSLQIRRIFWLTWLIRAQLMRKANWANWENVFRGTKK